MGTVLVTGGAGFVGSALTRRLLERGDAVWCLDDGSTGSFANVEHLAGPLVLLRGDVREPLGAQLPGRPDAIVHLACPASPVWYQRDPVRTLDVAVNGTLQVLRLAEASGARVLHASTSEIYGDPEVHPQPEGYTGRVDPWSVRACYDEGKRAAETLCADFARTRGVDARVVRIFNTYGPRMAAGDGRVVSTFLSQALAGAPLTVHGDGSHTRCFCFVDDLVDGLLAALERDDLPGPVNLGSDDEVTVLELARLCIEVTGSPSAVVHEAPAPDDPTRRRPDLARARHWLGWAPRVGLPDGLHRTARWLAQSSSSGM